MNSDLEFPFTRPENLTALELIDWIERSNKAHKQVHLETLGMMWLAEDLAEGRRSKYGVQVSDQRVYQSALLTAGDLAIHLNWKKHRVVYDVEPTLQESLADMQTDNVLPGEILRQLPHPNPLFTWPAGHTVTAQDGRPAVMRAMYVSARTADGTMCSTHVPEAATYQLTFLSDLLDEQGRVATPDSVRMSFELKSAATSIDEIVKSVLKDFVWEPLLQIDGTHADKVAYMKSLVRFGVAHLLYTCSEKADIDRPVPSRTIAKGKNAGQPTKEAVLTHPLGYRIGPAIRSARERFEKDGRAHAGTGRTVAPHIRRAHLHTFKHGPGRTLSKVKWLPPIFVSADGQEYGGTIIPVTL
ncbi:hypothetical protein [Streptomyces sp. 5-10]|uniref:hypothetical protein n=1 Tax=Streptomyces sp. 5-10 TaxID=878925 RepID=UPI00168AA3A7|nr:hypothetical protein [Streptomyces sp. 5-10]MBD3004689.1 hypothetical protein [Streptomyces sp. 5-10]